MAPSPGPGFCHLHVRSGFSYGLGTATPEELACAAARMGYRSLALTDRNGLYGVPRFLAACKEYNLSRIVGTEITVQLRKPDIRGHVVLLADSERGYRGLCRMLTAFLSPAALAKRGSPWPSARERTNPACDLKTLLEGAGEGGLVCLSGAIPFGLVPSLTLSKDTGLQRKSGKVLCLLREAFGEGNLFVELTDDGTQGSRRRMRQVEALAGREGLPTIAAHEVTYLRSEDHRLSETLAAAHHLSALPPPHFRPTDRLYLRSTARMAKLFVDRPEAMKNATAVAERCAGAVRLGGKVLMPEANLRDGEEAGRKLMRLALSGAREFYPDSFSGEDGAFPSRAEIKARLRREISCIHELGFTDYFLIAKEAVEIAKERGVAVTGRGSAANSLVARCLHLTRPDPFEHRLFFERFLHEGRADPPDIDLDFDSEYRDSVRNELMERYSHLGCALCTQQPRPTRCGAPFGLPPRPWATPHPR